MELWGWPGVAAISVPLVLLVASLVLHAIDARRGRRRAAEAARTATGRYGKPVGHMGGSAPQVAEAERAPDAPRRRRLEDVLSAVAEAEARRDERRLAALWLELAGHEIASGRTDEAAATLRKSIRVASRLGLKNEHAAARLELGDLSRLAGDLTTACEHWQIARGLYFELERRTELAAAETRMSETGCPTDWVLNDF